MIFAIDFDRTVVEEERDPTKPLRFMPGAREGLLALKRAGHVLLLYSGRANRANMYLAEFDPLVRAGVVDAASDDETRAYHADRLRQMLAFLDAELPGVFDAVDDGRQGKPEADKFVDDRALKFGGAGGWSWSDIADTYGE